MLTDAQGLAVTTDALEVTDVIDQFTDQLLSYGDRPSIIFEGLMIDPTHVLLNAHAAAMCLFSETATAPALAAPYLQAAHANLHTATEREQLYVHAIDAWATGQIDRALVYHRELAERYPRDLVAAFIGQYHHFYAGDNHGLLALIEQIFPANRDNHYAYGMLSFALEQCHRLDEAETMGCQAVEMNRHDPWAHHAVAHVLETQGRIEDGIAWMESFADVWETCGTFFTHNWWHVALYYLDQDDFTTVLNLYDTNVWGRAVKEYSACQIDAIALLLRLELRGVDVGDRWQTIGAYLGDRIHEHVFPFNDVHYIYALARSSHAELADTMLHSMQTHAATTHSFRQKTWMDVAVPTAHGMVAHARGDWSSAVAYLGTALPQMQAIGGSHAQRDLFEQVYLDALIQAHEATLANHVIEKRMIRRKIPALQRQLAMIAR
ncbi:MAG TPA: tetratricopeptide repeat protein [Crinalium sp.]|jgi:hypothetical protein